MVSVATSAACQSITGDGSSTRTLPFPKRGIVRYFCEAQHFWDIINAVFLELLMISVLQNLLFPVVQADQRFALLCPPVGETCDETLSQASDIPCPFLKSRIHIYNFLPWLRQNI